MENGGGLPGLRGVEHIGFTVPDLEEATRFFVDVIGCEYFYSLGPIEDAEGDWMVRHLNVPARTRVRELRFFRCGFGPNFEIFEYDGDDRNAVPPRNCDVGGHHLAFYVDDFGLALAYLKRPPVAEVAAWIQGHNLLRSPPFRVDRFGLYSSWRTHEGSAYRLEAEYPLG